MTLQEHCIRGGSCLFISRRKPMRKTQHRLAIFIMDKRKAVDEEIPSSSAYAIVGEDERSDDDQLPAAADQSFDATDGDDADDSAEEAGDASNFDLQAATRSDDDFPISTETVDGEKGEERTDDTSEDNQEESTADLDTENSPSVLDDDNDLFVKLGARRKAIQSTFPDGRPISHPFFGELVAEERQTFRSVQCLFTELRYFYHFGLLIL